LAYRGEANQFSGQHLASFLWQRTLGAKAWV
jgi:hypothetical protein